MAPVRMRTKVSHEVQKREKILRPKHRKGSKSKRTSVVRDVIQEVAGLSPYEKRLLDMIKTGGASSEKRMYKYAKQRLGTHKRAVKKREHMKDIYAQIRARQAMA
uniref:60S ribosomal protein L36 n=1 Tax=Aureoumbra lagunensis TaxID=44058 RepID=A0A7S3NL61_9STRA|mmetsp:Transcript_6300/g.8841  ORF Transcript_6300/g.8841 Transcript_6300/m.8841 type:complete len:105 (-) Transcript_6300:259-573(-)|eukprot:CAMPEP_0197292126 /NCGR_PEP_ID=MMETSP0890-20130614/21295_1 /TAXON_ID=44058 ORGANISM="Aureoumbra lagunensis, Strain CCMP1510" /NCGR_SAMPLE_ID=MMETSP0890 /ASSEMBLY_ACC=CAM_ASM_000533 /LENGTH=104 /DNA_ID=CAMNT_0042765769 /DNA_START=45 /DNA_END=359 /DNA_ORIENTATION=-